MKNLYKFNWDCGRNGEIEGLFVATQNEIDDLIGRTVYFGEVLGKHSDVYGEIEVNEITKIDIDQETIEKVSNALGSDTWSGYNPLQYVEEDAEED